MITKHIFKSTRSKEIFAIERAGDEIKLSISVHGRQYAGVHISPDQCAQLVESVSQFYYDIKGENGNG